MPRKPIETKPVEWFEENLKNKRAEMIRNDTDMNRLMARQALIKAEIVELANLISRAKETGQEIPVNWRDKMDLRTRLLAG